MVRIARRRQSSTRKLGIGGMISFNYREIVKVAPIPARLEILRVLEEDAFGNISLAARMCGVS
ncbi:MAG: hypothetical protein DRP11_02770 [Candidatus Aenigmatarchaeota archaeon]|nr:MAG: hypothetical protein DRP11_02770 [Candidatus Aenigmarchaeota archaeon]